MPRIEHHFVTSIYREDLAARERRGLVAELARACRDIAAEDRAGQAWSAAKAYPGYTSYASLNDLPDRDPAFADLVFVLDAAVARFARAVEFDLSGRALELDSLWINVLDPGGYHSAHIHPHSVISGTFYVAVPKGASAIKFEDPRLALMMAAPPRKETARAANLTFATVSPEPGTLLLWESWLRHEVLVNRAKGERISVSFNYRLL